MTPEWTVKITCPGCGAIAGRVVKWPDNPFTVNLATDTAAYLGCVNKGCPGLRWPTEEAVLVAAEQAQRRPDRSKTIRAQAAKPVDVGRVRHERGDRLGEGPDDSARAFAVRRHNRRYPDSST